MATYTPLHDNVVVKPLSAEEVTKSGIILPDTADKEKPEQGEVIAVGAGRLLDSGQRAPMDVKVGDVIIFKKYSPDELPGDEKLLVLREEDVLAVISKS